MRDPHRVAPEEVLVGDGSQRDRFVLDLHTLLRLHSLTSAQHIAVPQGNDAIAVMFDQQLIHFAREPSF